MTYPVTLRPDYSGSAARSSEARATSIAKGLIALARAGGDLTVAEREAKDDREALNLLQRTATAPHSSANTTTFNQSIIDYTTDIMGAACAASAIIRSGAIKLSFGEAASIWCHGLSGSSAHVGYFGKGSPFRILQFDESKGVSLEAGLRLGFGVSMTNELVAHSNAPVVFRAQMSEDVTQGLEAILLDANPGVAALRPAGLLYNVQTVAAEGTLTGVDAMAADLAGLAAAVGTIGGEIIYVANIKEVTKIRARMPLFSGVYSSAAVSAGSLIAIAPRGLAFAGSIDGPRIDTSSQTSFVGDDALVAQQMSASGSPNTVMAPAYSAFQADLSIVRMILPDLTWGQRVPAGTGGCVAALTGTIKW